MKKYRAWDKINNVMFYSSPTLCSNMQLATVLTHPKYGIFGIEKIAEWPERFIIQQYSELNMLNGTEIYDGDIVEVMEHYDRKRKIQIKEYIGQIKFEEGSFGIFKHGYIEELYPVVVANYVKVIGNIYKDKKLMSKVYEGLK